MDNIGFVADENLMVVGEVKTTSVVGCNNDVSSVLVPVYGLDATIVPPVSIHLFGISRTSDPSEYWRNENRYPKFKKIAQQYLSYKLSSVASEHLFSTADVTQEVSQRMPIMAEETALLSSLPPDSMDDIELKSFRLQTVDDEISPFVEMRVETGQGDVIVAVQRNRASRPAIVTYNDLGLDYKVHYQRFFDGEHMKSMMEKFDIYHVHAPGQHSRAPNLPHQYIYPTLEEQGDQLKYVMGYFGLKSFIGFGAGAGANVLARFAIKYPNEVDALIMVNSTSTSCGWIEWGYQKRNVHKLRLGNYSPSVLDYLKYHYFGRSTAQTEITEMYRNYVTNSINPANLGMYIDSYLRRTDLGISRTGSTIKAPVLNITGSLSCYELDTVELNSRLIPTTSNWMKISECGNVLEECQDKFAEALRLFLQGEGLLSSGAQARWKLNDESVYRRRGAGSRQPLLIRITENPISQVLVC